MANDISSMLNSKLRFSGMASGLDTDSIIKQLMRAESMKVDKVKQDRQLLEWKRDNYREITNLVRGFKDSYFDTLKPESNFRSASAFATYKVASSDENIATVKANTGAEDKSHNLVVKQLATAAKIEGAAPATASVSGSSDITDFALQGEQISITLDGVTKAINLEDYSDIDDLKTKLQSAINTAFGAGKLDILTTGNKVEIKALTNGSTFSIQDASKLGFASTDNTSNRISLSKGLDSIEAGFAAAVDFDASANVEFVINGVAIKLNKTFADATINDVMTAVNSSSAGVDMKYNSLRDGFILTSKSTGAAEDITYTDTDPANGLLKALGIVAGVKTAGQDAIFDLDGVNDIQRSSNNFSVDGVAYTLKKADPDAAVTIDVNTDADALVEKIKEFVGKYNELIDKLNTEYSEKRDRDYAPLTDEQKEAMSEDDIKKWEEKAQAGLLKGDSIIGKIVSNMRSALYDSVDGTTTSLYKIGINTGTYQQNGKLVIDEDKLKAAITSNIDAVAQLFAKNSEISYEEGLSNSTKRQTRYEESGLAQRLYDIIQDNIRTIRDSDGKKGILLEKAGIAGDISEFKNIMSEEIGKKDTLIYTLLDKLVDKEDALYKKFTAMETALNQMNSQSAWLAQQFGGGQ